MLERIYICKFFFSFFIVHEYNFVWVIIVVVLFSQLKKIGRYVFVILPVIC